MSLFNFLRVWGQLKGNDRPVQASSTKDWSKKDKRQLESMRSIGRNGCQKTQMAQRRDPDFIRKAQQSGMVLPSLQDDYGDNFKEGNTIERQMSCDKQQFESMRSLGRRGNQKEQMSMRKGSNFNRTIEQKRQVMPSLNDG